MSDRYTVKIETVFFNWPFSKIPCFQEDPLPARVTSVQPVKSLPCCQQTGNLPNHMLTGPVAPVDFCKYS
eukprot:jgi/Botrbrau1/11085/Bobra.0302s0027.1